MSKHVLMLYICAGILKYTSEQCEQYMDIVTFCFYCCQMQFYTTFTLHVRYSCPVDYRRFRCTTSSLSVIGGFAVKLKRIRGSNFCKSNMSSEVELSIFNEAWDTHHKRMCYFTQRKKENIMYIFKVISTNKSFYILCMF